MSDDVPRWRRNLMFWRDAAADVDDELSFHLEERARLEMLRGVPAERARSEAERRFGDVTRIRSELIMGQQQAVRRMAVGEWFSDVLRDIRHAARALLRAPVFTVTAVLALALGIGATTAVFSVVSAVLLRPLPYAQPERVVAIYSEWDGEEQGAVSPAEYLDYAEQVRAFDAVGVYAATTLNLVDGDVAERVNAAVATKSVFDALGVTATAGRLFSDEEDRVGGPAVALVSYDFWQSRFGGADIVGRELLVNGTPRTVVGVLPQGVQLPAYYKDAQAPSMFVPYRVDRASDPPRGSHFLQGVARLADGWIVASADAELKRVARALTPAYPDDYPEDMRFSAFVRPVHEDVVGDTRALLLILSATVALVLLIACANVSALVLTRTEDRRRELAIRRALGAGRGRIARQLLLETFVLALFAGAAGVLIAMLGVRALTLLQPGDIPRITDAGVDGAALAFTLAVCLLVTLVVALTPLRFGNAGSAGALRDGARTTTSRASHRVRYALIAGEVAVCIVLLAGAGLLLRSFTNLLSVQPGYRTEQLLTATVALPFADYPDDASKRRFFMELEQRASSIAGVRAAGAVINLPLAHTVGDMGIELPDRPVGEGDVSHRLDWQVVTPGWFDAMGVEIVRGRAITWSDDSNAPGAVVLSESAARKYWPDRDAIGERFVLGGKAGPGEVTVVGVARDIRHNALTEEPPAVMYLPHAQFTFWNGGAASSVMTLVLHTSGDPYDVLTPLREQVRQMDPHVPLGAPETMSQVVGRAVAEPRFATSVLGSFAIVALILAVIGVYGLVAYTVARRTREIAVRMALGAQPVRVVREFVRAGMRPVIIGVVIGVIGALLTARVLGSMLFGVGERDPITLAATAAVLLLTAGLAALLPSRRAALVAPMGAMREE